MSYENEADLASDIPFARRLASCITEEAKGKDDNISTLILLNPSNGAGYFMPFISTAPGFGEKFAEGGSRSIEDAEILSAVQANWEAVAELYPADPPSSPTNPE